MLVLANKNSHLWSRYHPIWSKTSTVIVRDTCLFKLFLGENEKSYFYFTFVSFFSFLLWNLFYPNRVHHSSLIKSQLEATSRSRTFYSVWRKLTEVEELLLRFHSNLSQRNRSLHSCCGEYRENIRFLCLASSVCQACSACSRAQLSLWSRSESCCRNPSFTCIAANIASYLREACPYQNG